jgi:nucleoside-diphosphate-sugar epimerase
MSGATKQRAAFVTGAAGCIGSALSKRLSQAGWRVIALVRDARRAAHLAALPGVELVEGDLEGSDQYAPALRDCEVVFHLAAKVHAPPDTPAAEFQRVNVEGTERVIAAALENKVRSLIFFSTVAVYAESDKVFDESSAPAPATSYGASKLAAEKLVLAAGAANEIKATVLRLPVVYGARDRGNVGKLIEAIKRGRYVIIGDGANLKTMVAAANVVDAALLAAADEKARGQVYLVCDARPYTQREIAEAIAEALQRHTHLRRFPRAPLLIAGQVADLVSQLTHRTLPLSADRVRKLTNNTRYTAAKIERELGFTPRLTLRDVLPDIINPH